MGPINSNLAKRLQNALVLANDPADAIGILEDPNKAAADKKSAADKAAAESAAMAAINILPECSLAKTNKSCRITIERTRPLTPPTLQMYSGANLTVIVKDPIFFERYFLDYQSGQATLSPDVASSIVQGLLAPLAKAGEFFDYDNIEAEQKGKDLMSCR